jgi:hypothetical protein
MSRRTVYLSEHDDRFLQELKEKHGSISKVIHISLNKLRAEQLKKYYLQKSESYPELLKAQAKVIKEQKEIENLYGKDLIKNDEVDITVSRKLKL